MSFAGRYQCRWYVIHFISSKFLVHTIVFSSYNCISPLSSSLLLPSFLSDFLPHLGFPLLNERHQAAFLGSSWSFKERRQVGSAAGSSLLFNHANSMMAALAVRSDSSPFWPVSSYDDWGGRGPRVWDKRGVGSRDEGLTRIGGANFRGRMWMSYWPLATPRRGFRPDDLWSPLCLTRWSSVVWASRGPRQSEEDKHFGWKIK